MHIGLELDWKFSEHIHHWISELLFSWPQTILIVTAHVLPLCLLMLWHFFYSCVIYFIRKLCHSSSVPPHPGIHFYFHLLVSFLLALNKQLTSSPLLCLCSLACQSASSEFNYPTVVLWCCLVSWWRIHYLITPLDKSVTTLSLPFIPLLALGLQMYSLSLVSSPACDLHCHLLSGWAHRALRLLENTETLPLWSCQRLRCVMQQRPVSGWYD